MRFMEETWKQAVSGGVLCPGYEVSSLGNVRSFRKRTWERGRRGAIVQIGTEPIQLKKIRLTSGYWGVQLVVGDRIRQRHIGPLVLESFCGPRPNGYQACHGPKGPLCDELGNLQWGTKSKNHGEDRLRDGTDVRGEKHGNSALTNEQVAAIKGRLKAGGRICAALAREYGVGRTTIAAIKYGRNWAWMESPQQGR